MEPSVDPQTGRRILPPNYARPMMMMMSEPPAPQQQQQQPPPLSINAQSQPSTPIAPTTGLSTPGTGGGVGPMGGSASSDREMTTAAIIMAIFDDLLIDLLLDTCFAFHLTEKTMSFNLSPVITDQYYYTGAGTGGGGSSVGVDSDMFGISIQKPTDTTIKCDVCTRPIGSSKFSAHLEKCLGRGRLGARGGGRTRPKIDYNENSGSGGRQQWEDDQMLVDESNQLMRGMSAGNTSVGNNDNVANMRSATPPVPSMMPAQSQSQYIPQPPHLQSQQQSQRYNPANNPGYYLPSSTTLSPIQSTHSLPPNYRQHDSGVGESQQWPSHPQYRTDATNRPPSATHSLPSQISPLSQGHYAQQSPSPLPLPSMAYNNTNYIPSSNASVGSIGSPSMRPMMSMQSPPPHYTNLVNTNNNTGVVSGLRRASEWWTEPLTTSDLPTHPSRGGVPHIVSNPAMECPEAMVPTHSQLVETLERICGALGSQSTMKLCCNKRMNCTSHQQSQQEEMRRKILTGEYPVRVKKAGKARQ